MKTLTDLAKQLRRNQTEVEKRLWYRLRARQIGGHKFRRQHQIDNFIADFVCTERMLIVEVEDIEAVLEAIRLALESPSPLPSPRKRGEGDER